MEELINLIETFKEFKDVRHINREALMAILNNVVRIVLNKKYGNTDNIDIVINVDKGTFEIWKNQNIVENVT